MKLRWGRKKRNGFYRVNETYELKRGAATVGFVQNSERGWYWYGDGMNSLWKGQVYRTAAEAKSAMVVSIQQKEATR
jgi:hypothetical protein